MFVKIADATVSISAQKYVQNGYKYTRKMQSIKTIKISSIALKRQKSKLCVVLF